MAGKIFINYRREDAQDAAARVHRELAPAFGAKSLFMDVDNLLAGQRFDKELDKALGACDVFLAIVGPSWLAVLEERQAVGKRDYVREEIAAALRREIHVIPVLVNGAQLPPEGHLSADIADLIKHQQHDVRHAHFTRDMQPLVAAIRTLRRPSGGLPWRGIAAGAVLAIAGAVGLAAWHFAAAPSPEPRTEIAAVPAPTKPEAAAEAAAKAEQKRLAEMATAAEAKRKADDQAHADAAAKAEVVRQVAAAVEAQKRRAEADAAAKAQAAAADAKWRADVQARAEATKAEADRQAAATAEAEKKRAEAEAAAKAEAVAAEAEWKADVLARADATAKAEADREAAAKAKAAAAEAKWKADVQARADATAKAEADRDAAAKAKAAAAGAEWKADVLARADATAKAEADRKAAIAAEAETKRAEAEATAKAEAVVAEAGRQRLATEAKMHPKPGTVFQDDGCPGGCPEMVVLPQGEFLMGSTQDEIDALSKEFAGGKEWFKYEAPQHKVTIGQPFAAGKYEVTRDQFEAFVNATGYSVGDTCFRNDGMIWTKKSGSFRSPGFDQTGTHPAVCINWDDATAYAAWLAKSTGKLYRLLTEAEWEYAARGATEATPQPRYPFGNIATDLCAFGNGADIALADSAATMELLFVGVSNCEDGYVHTAPVGSFKPNAFGLYDTLGNAWEWVSDCFVENYENAPDDGSARKDLFPDCRRSVRGGSWSYIPQYLRPATRIRFTSDFRFDDTGYRYDDTGFRVGRML